MGNENSRERKVPSDHLKADTDKKRQGAHNYTMYTSDDFLGNQLSQPESERAKVIFGEEYVKEALNFLTTGGQEKNWTKFNDGAAGTGINVYSTQQISKSSLNKPVNKPFKEKDGDSDDELTRSFKGQLSVKEEQECVPISILHDNEHEDKPSQKVKTFDIRQVKIGQIIGEGGFGRVFKANLNVATRVACKLILAPLDITEEMNTLLTLKHKNFVTVIGVIRQADEMDPPQLLLHYYPEGNLLQYLNRSETSKDNDTLGKFALDISEGCQFLHHKCNVVHGNLAARNILVEKISKNKKVYYNAKISDIGIIRFAEPSGVNYMKPLGWRNRTISLRWAPKEIVDGSSFDFTFSSDVWSFGVVLWEMWTRGAIPYGATYSNARIIQFLNDGYSPLKVHRPTGCPKAIVAVMEQTFQVDPMERPSFTELLASFQQYKGHGTVTASGVGGVGGGTAQSTQKDNSSASTGSVEKEAKDLSQKLKDGDDKQQKKMKEKAKKKAESSSTSTSAPSQPEDTAVQNAGIEKPETVGGSAKAPKSLPTQKPAKRSESSEVDSTAAEIEALRKKIAQLEKHKRGGGGGRGNAPGRGRGNPGQDKRGGAFKPRSGRGGGRGGGRGNDSYSNFAGSPFVERGGAVSPSPLFHAPPPPYTEEPLPYHSNPHLPATLPSYEYGTEGGRRGYGGYFGRGRPASRAEGTAPVGKEEDTNAKMKQLEAEMALLQAEKRMQEAKLLMKVAAGAGGTSENRSGFTSFDSTTPLSRPMSPHQADFSYGAQQYTDGYGAYGAPDSYRGHRGHRRGSGGSRSHQWRPYHKGRGGGKGGRAGHNNNNDDA